MFVSPDSMVYDVKMIQEDGREGGKETKVDRLSGRGDKVKHRQE